VNDPVRPESLDDPRLDPFRDVRDKDLRGHHDLFMVESMAVIERLLESSWAIHALLLTDEHHRRLVPAIVRRPDPPTVFVLDLPSMCELAGFHIHRGALAAVRRPTDEQRSVERLVRDLADRSRLLLLIAEGITNIDNMGGLFRCAAGLGADAIVLDPSSCDPLYRKVVRVSMGHVLRVPWARCRRWPEDLATLRSSLQLRLDAAETGANARPAWKLGDHPRRGILVGSEAHGCTAEAISLVDGTWEVPMQPGVPSLNVSVAAAVMLYECTRARAAAE